ncbi:hypothetical protein [Mycoplasmopsis cynos]|nr:hypothetical protein [Mycoplasmopsis cynos]MCU9932870.1 hypothetical protein [Mycoplasmopsis cynos]MCU9936429.1 hypothetical protein [Mycoplasmopsis cynos]UWV80450.1 hypothetical protein NW069_03915 [Mycoplasmopsis cynos]UWV81417.1 hypothetical protein NW065_05805 [Mycoplasmopsis cynos]UWV93831.1 hypothetical protein NW062_00595 [Mycoplasmopsis cynos]
MLHNDDFNSFNALFAVTKSSWYISGALYKVNEFNLLAISL